jgi:hypothetical protein
VRHWPEAGARSLGAETLAGWARWAPTINPAATVACRAPQGRRDAARAAPGPPRRVWERRRPPGARPLAFHRKRSPLRRTRRPQPPPPPPPPPAPPQRPPPPAQAAAARALARRPGRLPGRRRPSGRPPATHPPPSPPTGARGQGANRPSAREVSLKLARSPYWKASSRFNTSYLLSALGQIIGAAPRGPAAPRAPRRTRGGGGRAWGRSRRRDRSPARRAPAASDPPPPDPPAPPKTARPAPAFDTARIDATPKSNGGKAPILLEPGDPQFSLYTPRPGEASDFRATPRTNLSFTRSLYARRAGEGG